MPHQPVPKTPAERLAEAEKLKAIKPHARRFNMFGNDDHQAIDAAVATLSRNLAAHEIEAEYSANEYARYTAMEARQWADGTVSERPSARWEALHSKRNRAQSTVPAPCLAPGPTPCSTATP